jgi:hypothetical protein
LRLLSKGETGYREKGISEEEQLRRAEEFVKAVEGKTHIDFLPESERETEKDYLPVEP